MPVEHDAVELLKHFSCFLDVTTLSVETGGLLTAAGTDRPLIMKSHSSPLRCDGAGGAYASNGGNGSDPDLFLKPYGSLYLPREFGTDGCKYQDPGGNAGGLFFLTIGYSLHLDGTLSVQGQNGGPSSSGGGSGGSILLSTVVFTGNGILDVSGGSGKNSNCGGGSGGRLAVYVKSQSRYFGQYRATGGSAGHPGKDISRGSGGLGSVYIQEFINQVPHDRLVLDNKNRPFDHYLTLNESQDSYEFDEVHLVRNASLHMVNNGKQLNLTIHKILGDGTGLIHVHDNQLLKAEVKDAMRTITRAQANFRLDVNSSAIMSTVVHMIGQGEIAFEWHGRLINVMHLHLAYGRRALIGIEAHTGTIENDRFVSSETEGTFHFSTLEFSSKSKVTYPSPHGMHFTVGLLVSISHYQKLVTK